MTDQREEFNIKASEVVPRRELVPMRGPGGISGVLPFLRNQILWLQISLQILCQLKFLVSSSVLVLLSTSSLAAPGSRVSQLSASSAKSSKLASSPWSFDLNSTYFQEMVHQSEGEETRSLLSSFGASYRPPANGLRLSRLQGNISYLKDFKNSESENQGIGDFSANAKWSELPAWGNFRQTIGADLVWPLSEKSRISNGLRAAVGWGYGVSSFGKNWWPGFRFGFGISFAKYLHQYETSTSGEVLTSYRVSENLGLGYSLKSWDFSVQGEHQHKVNYDSRVSQVMGHSEQISWNFHRLWALKFGHTNEGPWFKEDEQSMHASLINEDSSTFFLGLSGRFE